MDIRNQISTGLHWAMIGALYHPGYSRNNHFPEVVPLRSAETALLYLCVSGYMTGYFYVLLVLHDYLMSREAQLPIKLKQDVTVYSCG